MAVILRARRDAAVPRWTLVWTWIVFGEGGAGDGGPLYRHVGMGVGFHFVVDRPRNYYRLSVGLVVGRLELKWWGSRAWGIRQQTLSWHAKDGTQS